MEVQENEQEIIEHNENKQGELEEQGAQEILRAWEWAAAENIPHLFISRRWWNIIEESWDGKVQ